MLKTNEMFSNMLSQMAKPHTQIDSPKIEAISNVLKNLNMYYVYHPKIGIIASKNKRFIATFDFSYISLIVMSHIDIVKEYNNQALFDELVIQMQQATKYEPYELSNKYIDDIKGYIIKGALDNVITNALLLSFIDTRVNVYENSNIDDILFLFTIGEECPEQRGFQEPNGAKKFFKKYHNQILKNKICVLNLDVTSREYNGFYQSAKSFDEDKLLSAAIEYDHTLWDYRLDPTKGYKFSTLKPLNYFQRGHVLAFCDYGKDGTSDDLEEATNYKIWGITLGLFTEGTIHKLNNYTTFSKIDKYFYIMHDLIFELKRKRLKIYQ